MLEKNCSDGICTVKAGHTEKAAGEKLRIGLSRFTFEYHPCKNNQVFEFNCNNQ